MQEQKQPGWMAYIIMDDDDDICYIDIQGLKKYHEDGGNLLEKYYPHSSDDWWLTLLQYVIMYHNCGTENAQIELEELFDLMQKAGTDFNEPCQQSGNSWMRPLHVAILHGSRRFAHVGMCTVLSLHDKTRHIRNIFLETLLRYGAKLSLQDSSEQTSPEFAENQVIYSRYLGLY